MCRLACMQQVDMKKAFHFRLSPFSPVRHSHINSFCQSHKQFSCPPPLHPTPPPPPPPAVLPCYRSFSKRGGSRKSDRRGGEEKGDIKKDFFRLCRNTLREKMFLRCLFSLTPLPVDKTTMNKCRHLLRRGDDKR